MFSFSQAESLIYSFALPQGFISFYPVLLQVVLSELSSSFIITGPSRDANIRREALPAG
jgi:hypothetical protein